MTTRTTHVHNSQDVFKVQLNATKLRSFTCGFLGGVKIGFFLSFADVLLISYSLVAKPVGNLENTETRRRRQVLAIMVIECHGVGVKGWVTQGVGQPGINCSTAHEAVCHFRGHLLVRR